LDCKYWSPFVLLRNEASLTNEQLVEFLSCRKDKWREGLRKWIAILTKIYAYFVLLRNEASLVNEQLVCKDKSPLANDKVLRKKGATCVTPPTSGMTTVWGLKKINCWFLPNHWSPILIPPEERSISIYEQNLRCNDQIWEYKILSVIVEESERFLLRRMTNNNEWQIRTNWVSSNL
jgi:hypothetical protein